MALGKKKKSKKLNYYDAFEAQAEYAVKEAHMLLDIVKNFSKAEDIEKQLPVIHELEHKADEVCVKVYEAIMPDFITPIDRENIVALVDYQDELVDMIEEVAQDFYMYDIRFMHSGTEEFVEFIIRATEALQEAIKEFRHAKKSETFKELLTKVSSIEDEADILYMNLMRKLYTEEFDHPVRIMIWTNIYNTLESCVDQCQDIAEYMRAIVLKHG